MTYKISRLLAFVLCVASAHALAGVGGQSAGVIPTGAGTNTDPSAAVQQQSAGFVQQNAANGNAAGTPQGTASSTVINGVVQPGSSGAGGARDKALDANGAAQAAAPAVPAAPPPPPPTYVSNVKRVTSAGDAGATSTSTATALPAAAAPAAAKRPDTAAMEPQTVDPDAAAAAPKPAAPHPAPPKAVVAANTANPATGKPAGPTKSVVEANIITGGSGAAPEGYTFYLGIGVAMALLVFALTTYLRTQKDETARRRPG